MTSKPPLAILLLFHARLIHITLTDHTAHCRCVQWFLIASYGCWLYKSLICRTQHVGLKKTVHLQLFCSPVASTIHGKFRSITLRFFTERLSEFHIWLVWSSAQDFGPAFIIMVLSVNRDLLSIFFMLSSGETTMNSSCSQGMCDSLARPIRPISREGRWKESVIWK